MNLEGPPRRALEGQGGLVESTIDDAAAGMLFNSLHFAVFFPIVVLAYFSLPPRSRWPLLLVASLYFYMSWMPEYVLLLIFSSSIDYVAALHMVRTDSRITRRLWLILSLLGNFGILFFFKYLSFSLSVVGALGLWGPAGPPAVLQLLLPLGISFYTFQAASYAIDVYRGVLTPERHYGKYLLYVTYFPHLVAGPIMRTSTLLPQLMGSYPFEYARVTSGLKLMAWGLFKKIVIADRCGHVVDAVYGAPQEHSPAALVVGTLFFAAQIYYDFSGYTDIATGAARVMGVRLMVNFQKPYAADSVVDFWRRWHISLSTWFRDYLYLPLGGSRRGLSRQCLNLLIVFLVSGLWHGADWKFVIWGLWHGSLMVASVLTAPMRARFVAALGLEHFPRWHRAGRVLWTFLLVNVGWVFFRAKDLADARYILSHMATGWSGSQIVSGARSMMEGGVLPREVMVALCSLLVLQIVERLRRDLGPDDMRIESRGWVRWSLYYAFVLYILCFGVFDQSPFLYFQF